MALATRHLSTCAFLLAVWFPLCSVAASFTVTNTSDSGPGSLRQAILNANSNPGLDAITFAIGSGPQTIKPLSALPTISDPVVVDGMSQPGYAGSPLVELDGSLAGLGANGLSIAAGSCTVQGLAIRGFKAQFSLVVGGGNGILITIGGGNTIRANFIGTDRTGAVAAGNGGDGIQISNSSANIVGGAAASALNLISGNANGIRILGSSDANVVSNNRIGTNLAGSAALGNGDGVTVLAGNSNTLTHNLISGNGGNGVTISGSAINTVVQGNRIGTNATATAALGNAVNGVQVSGAGVTGTQIGGDSGLGEGNVISANGLNGVSILSGASANHIDGNRIGTDVTGLLVLGNAFNGVIVSGASSNSVGDSAGIARGYQFGNVICGNGTNGIRLRSGATGNGVTGNLVGLNANGAPAGNLGSGIQINDGATGNYVGVGGVVFGQNAVGGNVGDGILITDPTTTGNAIRDNIIGEDFFGHAAGNGGNGISITAGASNNSIGGLGLFAGNRIRNNGGNGVFVEGGTGNTIRANSIHANSGLGIDLAPAGITPNDHCDGDTGANQLMNFPLLLSVVSNGDGQATVQGSLDAAPNSPFDIDFYANTNCDPSGNGEGQSFVGTVSVSTDSSCSAPFQVIVSSQSGTPIHSVTATATDASGNTSEFSSCVIVPAAFFSLTPCRVIDTRGPIGPLGGPALVGNTDRSFAVVGNCGVPLTARAVAINVTVTQASTAGHLRLYAGGDPLPPVSTINYSAGQTRANNAIVTLGLNGDFVVRCAQSSGGVQLIVDVVGYFE